MSIDLKPCPFCGSESVIVGITSLGGNEVNKFVLCTLCNARGPSIQCDLDTPGTGLIVEKRWNKRFAKNEF